MRNILELTLKDYLRRSLSVLQGTEISEWSAQTKYLRENITKQLAWIVTMPEYQAITYNSQNADFIFSKAESILDAEEKRALETFVYVQKDLERKERRQRHKEKMLADGWLELTEEIVKTALEQHKKIQLSAEATNDWMTVKVSNVYKPALFNNRQYGLMKTNARTRGYSIQQFDNAFCKLI